MAFGDSTFQNFPGGGYPGPPYDPSSYATPRVDERPPSHAKKFLTTMPMTLHGMIKFGRANSPNTPPPSKKMVVSPLDTRMVSHYSRFVTSSTYSR